MIARLLSTLSLVPALALTACSSSGATTRTACAVIDLADKACDTVVVRLGDGREVTVPRAAIVGVAVSPPGVVLSCPAAPTTSASASSSAAPRLSPKAP